MTIVERLAELKQHLEHLRGLRERVASVRDLEGDMSLHNDVLDYDLVLKVMAHLDPAEEFVRIASRRVAGDGDG